MDIPSAGIIGCLEYQLNDDGNGTFVKELRPGIAAASEPGELGPCGYFPGQLDAFYVREKINTPPSV